MEAKMTMKGWLWLCPIYLAETYNGDDDGCEIEPRSPSLQWLLSASEWIEEVRIGAMSLFFPNYEPSFMILVTGERK